MPVHYYSDTAVTTTLVADITAGATSMQVASITGYPSSTPYYLTLDRLNPSMEVVDVTGPATGTGPYTLPITRGASGTTAAPHTATAAVEHIAPAAFYNAAEAALNTMSPIGSIVMWATGTPPTGWLICDGSTYSSGTYPLLFALLGTTTLPDLRDRVPIGTSGTKAVKSTGGAASVTLTSAELPGHTHAVGTLAMGTESADHSHTYSGTSSGHSANHTHGLAGFPTFYVSGTLGAATADSDALARGAANNRAYQQSQIQSGNTTGASVDHSHTYSGTSSGRSAGHTHPLSGSTASTGSGSAFSVQNPYVSLHFIIRAA